MVRPPLSMTRLCKNESFSDVSLCGVLRKNWHHGQVIVGQEQQHWRADPALLLRRRATSSTSAEKNSNHSSTACPTPSGLNTEGGEEKPFAIWSAF